MDSYVEWMILPLDLQGPFKLHEHWIVSHKGARERKKKKVLYGRPKERAKGLFPFVCDM